MRLLEQKRRLEAEIGPLGQRVECLGGQIAEAKAHLLKLGQAVDHLREERTEMLSRRARARVRLDMEDILAGSCAYGLAADEALENARESILQLEHVAGLDHSRAPEADDDVAPHRLRAEAQRRADLEALARLRGEAGQEKAV